ncbi:MAG: hypothetical protein ACRECR_00710, partial [Thermoplasmata archaeon]
MAAPTLPTSAPAAPAPPVSPPVSPPLAAVIRDLGAVRRDRLRALEWTVAGAAKVLGPAEVGFARFNGSVSVGGDLTAEELTGRGELLVGGKGRFARTLSVAGTSRFLSDVSAGELLSRGRLEVAGGLSVTDAARVQGTFELTGALRAGTLTFAGSIRAGGPVTAGRVVGTIEGACRTGPIRAR